MQGTGRSLDQADGGWGGGEGDTLLNVGRGTEMEVFSKDNHSGMTKEESSRGNYYIK
jgi:hypothetical protein